MLLKRLFDVVFAAIFLVILSPLLLVLALVVGVGSRGGVFYRQERVGRGGVGFQIWKFRTMYTNSDQKGLLTVGDRDPRVTPVGYWLRKYKLDELPQLFNVLAGEMSIVGPRPEVRRYTDLYTPEQQRVLSIAPGITDYASITYADESELLAASDDPEKLYIDTIMPAKLRLNLAYIDEQSLATDLKIILDTALRIIRKRQ